MENEHARTGPEGGSGANGNTQERKDARATHDFDGFVSELAALHKAARGCATVQCL